MTPQGDAGERFVIENGRAAWKSPVDGGDTAYSAARFYTTFGGPIDLTAWLIERLVAAPNHTVDLLPGGVARAEKLTTLEVGDGAMRQTINGFIGVKFYGTFNPQWLPAAIAEAKKLGLHVHGHIPAGMRPLEAIEAGYDEITHINWVLMQAMPDEVIKVSNGIARFEGPGRYGRTVAVDAPPLRALLTAMASKGIASDPTMVAFEGLYVPEMGDLARVRAVRRNDAAGHRAQLPAWWIRRAEGSDARGLPRQLRHDEDARGGHASREGAHRRRHGRVRARTGPRAGNLRRGRAHTCRSAGNRDHCAGTTGESRSTHGSIEVGKAADLVLVDGDPSKRIGDLRQARIVMMDGRLMDADALRKAAGFAGPPKQ